MKQTSTRVAAVIAMCLMASLARAETGIESARASVAPFYKALNAEFAGDSPNSLSNRPRRNGSPAAATMSATAARKSSRALDSVSNPFRT
jgi:hypothetical protein